MLSKETYKCGKSLVICCLTAKTVILEKGSSYLDDRLTVSFKSVKNVFKFQGFISLTGRQMHLLIL